MHHRRALMLVIAGLAIGTIAGIASYKSQFLADEDTSVPLVQAKKADSFVDSIGMGIHGWWTPITWDKYVSALKDLNIRYVREDLAYSYYDATQGIATSANIFGKWQQLNSNGISVLGISHELKIPPADLVSYIKETARTGGKMYAVEGPNEVDYQCAPSGTTFTGQIWVLCPDSIWRPRTETYVTNIWSGIKNDSATSSTTIYSPSINSANANGSTVFASKSEYGNLHHYPYLAGGIITSFRQLIADARVVYPGKPLVITEIGYPGQASNTTQYPASESMQANLLPLYLLEGYKQGVSRTFLYQLVDDRNGNDYFGLLDDITGRRRPAFSAIQNLTNLLKDPGASFTPGSLRVQVSGSSEVSSLLFQKHDGRYFLMLWQPALTNSPVPPPNQTVSPKTVSVKFGNDIQTATTYKPTDSASAINTVSNPTTISDVAVGPSALVIEITPAPTQTNTSTGTTGGTPTTTTTKKKKQSSTVTPTITPPAETVAPSTPANPDGSIILPDNQVPKKLSFWERLADLVYRAYQWVARLW